MIRLAILAALEREVAPLLRSSSNGWRRDAGAHPQGVSVWTSKAAVIAIAGMGSRRAALAFEAALATGPVSQILSVGWAGACDSGLQVGTVLRPSMIVDAQTGERFACAEGDGSLLATVAAFAGCDQKRRLHAAYGASAVEMEAATLARLAEAHGLAFRAVKCISDAAEFDFPGIEGFHTADGKFRELAFGFHAALRPWLWASVAKMAAGSKLAAEKLCAELAIPIEKARKDPK